MSAQKELATWFHTELGVDRCIHPHNTRATCEAWADQLMRTFLAKHDAEVRAKALRDAAEAITREPIPYGASFNSTTDYMAGRAHARLILHARATTTTEVGADG